MEEEKSEMLREFVERKDREKIVERKAREKTFEVETNREQKKKQNRLCAVLEKCFPCLFPVKDVEEEDLLPMHSQRFDDRPVKNDPYNKNDDVLDEIAQTEDKETTDEIYMQKLARKSRTLDESFTNLMK
jgi:hypothetical protein